MKLTLSSSVAARELCQRTDKQWAAFDFLLLIAMRSRSAKQTESSTGTCWAYASTTKAESEEVVVKTDLSYLYVGSS